MIILEYNTIPQTKASPRTSKAAQKADIARYFADEHKTLKRDSFKSAWLSGGAHCYLAAYSPFSPVVEKLVTTSAVAVVKHIVHIADELDKMGMINMPDRRKRKEQNNYLRKALEAYAAFFYRIPVEKALYDTLPDAGYLDAAQIFHDVVEKLPNDISPQAIYEDRQPISSIIIGHISEEVDRTDVIEFVSSYDPFHTRGNALGARQTNRLVRRAKEQLQAFDPSRTAYEVAMATHYQDLVA